MLPKSTIILIFGQSFNHPVDMLPKSIKKLKFGYSFNRPVNMLPTSIEELTFGHSFDQPVNMLPALITYIFFCHSFNQSVDMLPSSIETLIFGYSFNKPLNRLPKSIVFISTGYNFEQPINMLSTSIEMFVFVDKVLLSTLHTSKLKYIILENPFDGHISCPVNYKLKKRKNIKNENISFSKHVVNIDVLQKLPGETRNEKILFYTVKKIPYGCVYDKLIYI